MTLLVRDEEDIISTSLKYHLSRGVDFIIVTDNLSVDKTPVILEQFEREGFIHVIKESNDDYSQGEWVTRMARMAFVEYGADWVINSDADEFWWTDARNTLKDPFEQITGDWNAVTVPRKEFLPIPFESDIQFFQSMIFRQKEPTNLIGNPLPNKVCHRGNKDIKVAQGNHAVLVNNLIVDEWTSAELSILHFPLRSYKQFENKIVNGGAAYSRNRKLNPNVGNVWRNLYERYKKGDLSKDYNERLLNRDDIKYLYERGEIVKDESLKNFLNLM